MQSSIYQESFFMSLSERQDITRRQIEETKRKEDKAKRVEEERQLVTRLLSETANADPPPVFIL